MTVFNNVVVSNNQIQLSQEVTDIMLEVQRLELEAQIKKEEVKQAIEKAMVENDIKSFENDFFKMIYIAPSTRKTLDVKKLKKDMPDIYDEYTKESQVKGSVRFSWK